MGKSRGKRYLRQGETLSDAVCGKLQKVEKRTEKAEGVFLSPFVCAIKCLHGRTPGGGRSSKVMP